MCAGRLLCIVLGVRVLSALSGRNPGDMNSLSFVRGESGIPAPRLGEGGSTDSLAPANMGGGRTPVEIFAWNPSSGSSSANKSSSFSVNCL